MRQKVALGIDVLTAAQRRIAWTFDTFERICVSFSGGKDSTVMLHLVMEEARRRQRRVGVLFIDLEGQYRLTIDHIDACYRHYADLIEPYWIALPIALRNAVSQFEPKWMCWDPAQRDRWVREPGPLAITDGAALPFFRPGMEFEEFTPAFARWFARGRLTATLVGIRADESLNRYRSIMQDKTTLADRAWTTWMGEGVYNVYPIYDWRTEDIWTWHSRHPDALHNRIYDRMHQAGLTPAQMRICQPYGDDQRKGLWLFHVLEPETWSRIVARVNGANHGALYADVSGVMLGRLRIDKPAGHSWQSYTEFLLASMPPRLREHYEVKIRIFLRWWEARGYAAGIPDEAPQKAEAAKDVPSWRRICRTLLKNDYWCKGLTFSQHKSESYEKYMRIQRNKRMTHA